MKRVIVALATVALAAGALVALERRRVGPRGRAVCSRAGRAAAAAGGDQGAEAVEHRGQVRLAAVRLHRRAEPERRVRRRDRKWFSRFAFGKSNRVTYTCVTTPAREPAITTGRVDMVIATFTYTDRP